MSPEEFIKKHITDALVGDGFPEQVALGGGWLAWTIITECHRQAVRDALTRTVCSMRVSGQKDKRPRRSVRQRKSRVGGTPNPACSDFAMQYLRESIVGEKFHE